MRKYIQKLLLMALSSSFGVAYSQKPSLKYTFFTYDSVPVSKGGLLKNPFTGGMNSPQFIEMDLDNDGTGDMIVFDRNDNKILPYLRKNGWVYSPQFENTLPAGRYWYKTADLNSDGKPDIFTLTEGGNLLIYKNMTAAGDKHTKWQDLGGQYYRNRYDSTFGIIYNILGLSKTDLPEIRDLDNDGDVDIVFYDPWNFSYSMFRDVRAEKGWHKDTWEFQDMDYCFGYFNEGFTNDFILGECAYKDKLKPRHVGGASLVMFDSDEDGDYEMLVSNIGFKKMTFLKNGKAQTGSYYDTMIQVDSIYPPNTKRAADFLFPAGFIFDYNNDGNKDLILAPNGFSDVKETDNVWLYHNAGKTNKPSFEFVTDKFICGESVDAGGKSAPAFCDYDGDGDQDLFVASNGDFELTGGAKDRIMLFKNTGTNKKVSFEITDSDFLFLSSKGLTELIIRFGDVDGDGDVDLYYGSNSGKVGWYRNTAGINKPAAFEFVSDDLLGNSVGLGMNNSAPVLYNYNNDTLPDMLVGMYNGRVALYVNNGTRSLPAYELATTRAWGMRGNEYRTDVTPRGFMTFGYAVPEVADIDNDGNDEILIGTTYGAVRLYQPAGRSVFDSLSAVSGWLWQRTVAGDSTEPDFGSRITLAAADLNSDSIPEFVFGTSRGGLYFAKTRFSQVASVSKSGQLEKAALYPNPASGSVRIERSNTAETWNVQLLDMTGRVLHNSRLMPGESNITLNLTSLKGGVYQVSMNNGVLSRTEPLMVIPEKP